ncbi:hypothetical protein CSIRO_0015 [Bradyrhizobiaceae bacterium SG-6C]|nr:hypothetical protein CSIRO_0015 [Bradyrhizobiaceae bacterium SG-6C]
MGLCAHNPGYSAGPFLNRSAMAVRSHRFAGSLWKRSCLRDVLGPKEGLENKQQI